MSSAFLFLFLTIVNIKKNALFLFTYIVPNKFAKISWSVIINIQFGELSRFAINHDNRIPRVCGLCVSCMHMCEHVYMFLCVHTEVRGWQVFSSMTLRLIPLKQDLSLNWEFMLFSGAGGKQALAILLSPPKQHWAYRHAHHTQFAIPQILRVVPQVLLSIELHTPSALKHHVPMLCA